MTEVYDMAQDAEDHATAYLGNEVKDKASGVTGICVSVLLQANGNIMLGIEPPAKDNKKEDAHFFDIGIIEVLGIGVTESVPEPEIVTPFDIGDKVKDKISGYAGVVNSISWFLNGCAQYCVISEKLDKESGKPISEFFLTERLTLVGENTAVKQTVRKQTGGPSTKVVRVF